MMRKFVLAVGLVLMASGAQAATLDVVGGQLVGASGVLVDGSLYDVQFLDGTCIDLYSGCDEDSDFTFQTQASAILAAQALLDQVFIDGPEGNFDSIGNLTNGCGPGGWADERCITMTPWRYEHPTGAGNAGLSPETVRAGNLPPNAGMDEDYIHACCSPNFGLPRFVDTAENSDFNFAVWSVSQVPEPNTALLLSLGLTGLAAKRRRSLRS